MVAVIRDVSFETHLHDGILIGSVPCVAPNVSYRVNVNVQFGLALQSVADSFGYRIKDQRKRLKQRLGDGLDDAGFGQRMH